MQCLVCCWLMACALSGQETAPANDVSSGGSVVEMPAPQAAAPCGDPVVDDSNCKQEEPTPLAPEQQAVLDAHYWDEWVGDSIGVWVSVDEQVLRIIRNHMILRVFPCATAAKGTGFVVNSMQTPLGWHSVKTKIGDGAPWGQVFRGAKAVNQIWKPGEKTTEDLVLTRLMWLKGEEPGVNQGGNVDSYNRFIYIHGTNDEARIGTPSSHGCVRLKNDDVIKAFDLIPKGARVLITEQPKPAEEEAAQTPSTAP